MAAVAWALACTPTQVRYQRVTPPATSATPVAVLYLVGDAGLDNPERADVLAHLSGDIQSVSTGATVPDVLVAFLGDNIYDEGLPYEPTEEDLDKLSGQVQALGDGPNVAGVFLPGNHDWANGASIPDGRAAIERQIEWIEQVSPEGDVRFLPDDGCPGPAATDLPGNAHLVFIDTEWLLRKPEQRCGTADAFYERLADDLRANRDRRIIVLSHHPLVSGGPHGGNVAPLEEGPFVYYLARKSGASAQDLSSGRYAGMVRRIREAIAASGAEPLAAAAGHDHTLQVISMSGPGAPAFQLVSGAGSKSERSRRIDGTRYATDGFGYMRLDFFTDSVTLTVFRRPVDDAPLRPVFGCVLARRTAAAECPEAPLAGDGS